MIFCHQEESSWPLDEGKKVKDRFDEIFDSDKYSNCFDKLKKIRKNYATEIKILSKFSSLFYVTALVGKSCFISERI